MNPDDSAAAQLARNQYTDLRLRVVAEARANDGVALEDHLRAPVRTLVESVAEELGYPKSVLAGEISGAVERARPDYTVVRAGLIIGHIELKAPGAGGVPREVQHSGPSSIWGRAAPGTGAGGAAGRVGRCRLSPEDLF